MTPQKKGSLIVVGTGINIISQTTISAQGHIEYADVVFIAVSGATAIDWIKSLNDNVVSLTDLYEEGKSRVQTYQQMVELIAAEVRAGKRVCAAYYGHPGVFVTPTHKVIKLLTEEGYSAKMDPGVSAEDCLIADLGIDPGNTGCQALEASQFLFYQHSINANCLLILWQVSLSGDHTISSSTIVPCQSGLVVLKEALLEYYPPDHQVIIYEASIMALCPPRIDRLLLSELPNCKPTWMSTLVIPGLGLPEFDHDTLAKLGLTAQQVIQGTNVA
jgi:uncharacterized protein YabN with tetrapyrrole methylase and pyrophosphatase domain